MRVTVKDLRKHLRADDHRLILRLCQVNERSATQSLERRVRERRVEHHVSEDRERRIEVPGSRYEIERSLFAANVCADTSAEQLQRIRELIASPGGRSLGEHRCSH